MTNVSRRPRLRTITGLTATAVALGAVLLGSPAMAAAATTSIDHVEPAGQDLRVVVSLTDAPDDAVPDMDTVTTTFDGAVVPSSAQLLSSAGDTFRRTTILALDVSASMRGERFTEAKAAANAFLDNVPDDVYVGLVTFANDVVVAQKPTRDTDALRSVIAGLRLSRQTRLYDGLTEAVRLGGDEGARNVLVLSDGRDTSGTKLADAVKSVRSDDVKVDVVALAQSKADEALLRLLAEAGNGQVLSADDPAALSTVFEDEARTLARQILVTVQPPESLDGKEGTLAVTLSIDGTPTTDEAFVGIPGAPKAAASTAEVSAPPPTVHRGVTVPRTLMWAGLGGAAVAVALMLVIAVGPGRDQKQDAIDRSIEAYTRKGAKKIAEANRQAQSQSMTQQALAVAESVLEGREGLEQRLVTRLEAAGMALKPAEWLLLHFAVAVGLGLAGLLLGGGSLLSMLLGLLFGLAGPWLYLAFRKKRRLGAFGAQLADTLQLMSGSLSAGLSLAQSVDTVVREGAEPMAGEFRRALVETRLGVDIEEALLGIANRMQSVDFEWVVMAIRIQREVGGNLAELLNKVADTIREREYLLRQVKTLSAEGRMSVWILGGLPPGFMGYLLLVNRSYVSPMFTNPLGIAMLVVMGVLLTGGVFWMKKVVKVEV